MRLSSDSLYEILSVIQFSFCARAHTHTHESGKENIMDYGIPDSCVQKWSAHDAYNAVL